MRKAARRFSVFLFVIISFISVPQFIFAGIDLTVIKQTKLDVQPLDIAISPDGEMVYVLARGEILAYSINDGKVSSRISVDHHFDKLICDVADNVLILSSSSSKTLKIVRVDFKYDISVDGLPYEGPADAPVTIAVFDDYQ